MTISESTVCSLLQSFPIFLILAQNHNKCLKTPLVYKPPVPTPTPEYYEALEALLQTLYHDNKYDSHHDHGYHGCHGESYGVSRKWPQQHATPCYNTYTYPSSSNNWYQTGYAYPGHVYSSISHYPSFKKVNIYNTSAGAHGYNSYAPKQVYNVITQKHKIVHKKKNRRRPQKLQGKLLKFSKYNNKTLEHNSSIIIKVRLDIHWSYFC